MSSATKQKSSAGKNVLIFFIVFILLEALVLFGIGRVFKNKDVTPSIAGYSLYLMDSGAMGDSVPQGSLVIASNNHNPGVDNVGEALVCENIDGIGTSVFRLYDINQAEDKSGLVYTIYQENDPDKLYEVRAGNIVGLASSYYMTAGKVLNFVISKFGFIVCLAVPLFLLVVIELIIAISSSGSYDEDDDEDEDDFSEQNKQPVSLDDFLFGGQNEGEQIANHRKQEAQAAAEPESYAPVQQAAQQAQAAAQTAAAASFARPEPQQPAYTAPAAEPVAAPVQETAAAAAAAPADLSSDDLKLDVSTPVRRPAGTRPARRRPRSTAPRVQTAPKESQPASTQTSASQSLEDLMKLMEAEQEKLKKQINNK